MKNRYRVVVLLSDRQGVKSKNCNTKDEAENFVLEWANITKVKQYRILDKKTDEIIARGEI